MLGLQAYAHGWKHVSPLPFTEATGNLANFWSYEWNKHGKCAAPLFNGSSGSLPEYFNQTVALNEQWDINVSAFGWRW